VVDNREKRKREKERENENIPRAERKQKVKGVKRKNRKKENAPGLVEKVSRIKQNEGKERDSGRGARGEKKD